MVASSHALSALALLLPASALAFNFVEYFEGDWDIEKTEAGGATPCEYSLRAHAENELRGTYSEAGKQLEVAVALEAGRSAAGGFYGVQEGGEIGAKLFSFDFAPHQGGTQQLSQAQDGSTITVFTVTSPTSFVLSAVSSGAGDGAAVSAKTFVGVKRAGAKSAKGAAPAKRKSLLRRYGFYLILLIIVLLLRAAWVAGSAGTAQQPAGKAKGA